jgi:hypothetical protein
MTHGLVYQVAGVLESTIPLGLSAVLPDGSAPEEYQRTQQEACKVMMVLGKYPHARSMMVDKGAVPSLVFCLRSAANLETKYIAMDALGLIASGGPLLARSVADAGAMEPLGEMLWTSAYVKSAQALAVLSGCGQAAAQGSWDSGADALVEILVNKDDNIGRQAALSAVCAMSQWGPQETVDKKAATTTSRRKVEPRPLSETLANATFVHGALLEMIEDIFRDRHSPPTMASTACETLLNLWRHQAALGTCSTDSDNSQLRFVAVATGCPLARACVKNPLASSLTCSCLHSNDRKW